MKAIETRYKGYRFRSRLEARWAVFFDTLGLEWEYEKEGYNLNGILYLPDFFIHVDDSGYFIEIKGAAPTRDEIKKCRALSVHYPVYLFPGQIEPPNPESYTGSWAMAFPQITYVGKGLIKECLGLGLAEYHMGSLTACDHRPYCWHERLVSDDNNRWAGTVLPWPVPANDFVSFDRKRKVVEIRDPLKAGTKSLNSKRLLAAYEAARSARFEFGESGAPL